VLSSIYHREKENLLNIIRKYELEITKIQNDLMKAKDHKGTLEQTVIELRTEVNQINMRAQESRDILIAQYDNELTRLRQQLKQYGDLNTKNTELSSRLATTELERDELRPILRKMDKDFDILRHELDEKTDRLRLIQKENGALREEFDDIRRINLDSRRQIESLENISEDKDKQLWSLQRQLSESIEKSSRLRDDLKNATEELKTLSKDMNIAAREIQALNKDLTHTIRERDTYRFEKENVRGQLRHAEEVIKSKDYELQGLYQTYKSLITEHETTENALRVKDQELIELRYANHIHCMNSNYNFLICC
jgi:chromosome segregation ATPase